jgi:hypothetical protein
MGGRTLEDLARDAAAGDSQALSRLVEDVQYPVYRLALRFLAKNGTVASRCDTSDDVGR